MSDMSIMYIGEILDPQELTRILCSLFMVLNFPAMQKPHERYSLIKVQFFRIEICITLFILDQICSHLMKVLKTVSDSLGTILKQFVKKLIQKDIFTAVVGVSPTTAERTALNH